MSDYEKARNKSAKKHEALEDVQHGVYEHFNSFAEGADWGRDYVLNSLEMKALVKAANAHICLLGPKGVAPENHCDHRRALSNFKAKFGGVR